jgi:hypothetical protein
MKRGLTHPLGFIASAIFAFAAGHATAQTTANGPYYAMPSWDQTLPSSTRFIVLSNMNSEAVLDRETGLVWQRSPSGNESWELATQRCYQARTGGRFGWRLPTLNELGSLFDPAAFAAKVSPPFPPGHPFTGLPFQGSFWSATPVSLPDFYHVMGWAIDTPTGTVLSSFGVLDAFLQTARVWCVRGGTFSGIQ